MGCQATGESIVIDAKRDVDTYLELAKQNGLRITHVTETHIHADFLSGTRELAALTGARMYLSDEGGPDWQYEFKHIGLTDGSVIRVGNLSLEVIHTPGHTPESISFLLRDHPASEEPVMLFTGDFVFVGDVGRPDLLEKAAGEAGTMDAGAREMFRSLQKFADLPGHLQVWPGHGAGSACGKALGAVPSSTVGYELARNWVFGYRNDEQAFVDNLLDGQPEPPTYFAMMKKLNKVDRPLLTAVPQPPLLDRKQFLDARERGAIVIDARDKAVSDQGRIPGSLVIPGNNSFATWAGWLVDYEDELVLIADRAQVDDLVRKLMRIGLDRVIGYLSDVLTTGLPLEQTDLIDLDTFRRYLGREDVQVIDVRSTSEYDSGHIDGVEHAFLGKLAQEINKIDRGRQTVVHCQSGLRAAIANSILAAHNIKNAKIFPGGMNEWQRQQLPVVREQDPAR